MVILKRFGDGLKPFIRHDVLRLFWINKYVFNKAYVQRPILLFFYCIGFDEISFNVNN